MSVLEDFFEQCGSVGVVVRNPHFALKTLEKSLIPESEKICKVFEQGRKIGTFLYCDKASFDMFAFGVFLGRFGIDQITAKRMAANLRPEPVPDMHNQETF